MNKRSWPLATVFAAALLGLSPATRAAEAIDGATLHQNNCIACHAARFGGDGSTIYTREDRRVTSLAGLNSQVRRCEQMLGLTWFDDQILAVADYLNQTYYHFESDQ